MAGLGFKGWLGLRVALRLVQACFGLMLQAIFLNLRIGLVRGWFGLGFRVGLWLAERVG